MRVAVFSHAYFEPENRKLLWELARHAELRVITPASFLSPPEDRDFRGGRYVPDRETEHLFATYSMLPLRRGGRIANYALTSLDFGLRRFGPDIIHVDHEPWAPVAAQAVGARSVAGTDARVVLGMKVNTYRTGRALVGPLRRGLGRAGLWRATRVIAASRATAGLVQSTFDVPREKIDLVPHQAVDVDLFSPAPVGPRAQTTPIVVGYAGRLHPEKGTGDLVEAVRRAHRKDPGRLRLRLLGSGPLDGWLRALAKQYEWLELLPAVPGHQVADFLRGLDIFAMPTGVREEREEHDGHAMTQALACGLPTVGTRSGILPELLDGVGVIVDPHDPDALAEALLALSDDPDRRRELGTRGRRRAEAEWAIEVVARRRIASYERASA